MVRCHALSAAAASAAWAARWRARRAGARSPATAQANDRDLRAGAGGDAKPAWTTWTPSPRSKAWTASSSARPTCPLPWATGQSRASRCAAAPSIDGIATVIRAAGKAAGHPDGRRGAGAPVPRAGALFVAVGLDTTLLVRGPRGRWLRTSRLEPNLRCRHPLALIEPSTLGRTAITQALSKHHGPQPAAIASLCACLPSRQPDRRPSACM